MSAIEQNTPDRYPLQYETNENEHGEHAAEKKQHGAFVTLRKKVKEFADQRTVTLSDGVDAYKPAIFDIKQLLLIMCVLFGTIQVIVTSILVSWNYYELRYFTYWNYTILTCFFWLMVISLWIEGWLLTFMAVIGFPFIFGTSMSVFFAIIILVKENPILFTSGDCSNDSISMRHTGDWILHTMPIVELMFILICGWLRYSRIVVSTIYNNFGSRARSTYLLWFIFSPLIIFGIYSILFDPNVHYPTEIPPYMLWSTLFTVDIIAMTLLFVCFTYVSDTRVKFVVLGYKTSTVLDSSSNNPQQQPVSIVSDSNSSTITPQSDEILPLYQPKIAKWLSNNSPIVPVLGKY